MTERMWWTDPIADLIEENKLENEWAWLEEPETGIVWDKATIQPDEIDGEMSIEDQNRNLRGAAEDALKQTTIPEIDKDLIMAQANRYDIEKGTRYIYWAMEKWNKL